jgi:hypothetical protein
MCAREPLMCARELSICAHEPLICARELSICAHEPLICARELSICTNQPLICANKPPVCARGVIVKIIAVVLSEGRYPRVEPGKGLRRNQRGRNGRDNHTFSFHSVSSYDINMKGYYPLCQISGGGEEKLSAGRARRGRLFFTGALRPR